MQNNRYFPMTLIAVAIVSGCSSMPQNSSLAEAHSSYDIAQTNPEVANLAALELKAAEESLHKAEHAFSEGENAGIVDHLAYIAKQQTAIAEETAKRKTAELAAVNAAAKRAVIRLKTDGQKAAIVQQTADRQTAELVVAVANTKRSRALIAQQERRLKALNAKKTERGVMITLGDALFRPNKAQLESGSLRHVQKLADFLKQYSQYKVSVEGHTDSAGSSRVKQALSERRAGAVQTALNILGVGCDRISVRGYADAFPVAGNDTAASRQMNRRVEIIFSDENGNIAPR